MSEIKIYDLGNPELTSQFGATSLIMELNNCQNVESRQSLLHSSLGAARRGRSSRTDVIAVRWDAAPPVKSSHSELPVASGCFPSFSPRCLLSVLFISWT